MFSIGDKVVYPMHGAGVIEDIEEKEIDGCSHLYYVLKLPIGNLTIMVSANNAENMGLRGILSSEKVADILSKADQLSKEMPENWNERYKLNFEKIKTGQLTEAVEVYRNLFLRESERGLSSVEKKLLTTAKQVILSEMVLSQGIQKEAAEDILNSYIQKGAVVAD